MPAKKANPALSLPPFSLREFKVRDGSAEIAPPSPPQISRKRSIWGGGLYLALEKPLWRTGVLFLQRSFRFYECDD